MKPTVDEAVKWFMMLSAGQGSSQEQSARLLQRVNANDEISTTEDRKKLIRYRTWWAAAAVILIFATAGFFLIKQSSKTELADHATPQKVQTDIAPGGNKAVLTLSDGHTIVLDNAANGALSQQGGTQVIKTDRKTLMASYTVL